MEKFAYVNSDERIFSLLCHLIALVPYLGVLGPLIIWFLRRDEYAEVNRQGKDSINFQLSIWIYSLVAGLLVFMGIGALIITLIGILNLIVVIVASIKSYNGERFEYPLSIRFIQ